VGGGMLFHGYTQILNRVFGFTKETVTPMVNFTIAGAVNVGLNLALIPWFGFMAAAWSTLSAYGVLFLITLKTCRSVIPLKFFQPYHWKGILGATGMGLFLNLYKDMVGSHVVGQMLGLVFSICGGVLVYTGLLFLLGELRYEKVRSLVIMMGGFLVRPFCLKKNGKI
jgi:O-antigen/teichoic acid export membrane protein